MEVDILRKIKVWIPKGRGGCGYRKKASLCRTTIDTERLHSALLVAVAVAAAAAAAAVVVVVGVVVAVGVAAAAAAVGSPVVVQKCSYRCHRPYHCCPLCCMTSAARRRHPSEHAAAE